MVMSFKRRVHRAHGRVARLKTNCTSIKGYSFIVYSSQGVQTVLHTEYFSPVVGIGTLPSSYPQASVSPPPLWFRGSSHSLGGEGVGASLFRRGDRHCCTVDIYMYVLCGILPYSAWRQMSDHNSFYACTLDRNK
jgi:hypothetical protein